MGLLFREHPKAQPEGGFSRVYIRDIQNVYLDHFDVGISYSCQILLLYGAKTNKTLV